MELLNTFSIRIVNLCHPTNRIAQIYYPTTNRIAQIYYPTYMHIKAHKHNKQKQKHTNTKIFQVVV